MQGLKFWRGGARNFGENGKKKKEFELKKKNLKKKLQKTKKMRGKKRKEIEQNELLKKQI